MYLKCKEFFLTLLALRRVSNCNFQELSRFHFQISTHKHLQEMEMAV